MCFEIDDPHGIQVKMYTNRANGNIQGGKPV